MMNNKIRTFGFVGAIVLAIVFFILYVTKPAEIEYVEKEKVVEKEVKVYIDQDTYDVVTAYWYYTYETAGGPIGWNVIECGPIFDYEKAHTEVENRLKEKYKGKKHHEFVIIKDVVKTDYESYKYFKE